MKLTQKRLRELLHYDPIAGVFTWLISKKGTRANLVAGSVSKNKDNGYRRIKIDGNFYKTSRLAWLYMEGYFPENDIDHENRIRHDDRWENLRHVSRQCNTRNSSTRSDNTSGITGVMWHKAAQKWQARIMISGKGFSLGLFQSKTNAAMARWEAEKKYGFPNCNTTSIAYLYLQKRSY